ncbi:alpha/beta fold hydrolase [Sinomonas flava]|uniref:alpha/beta fold hydrolase n=1 Tax=Sinomonas flava TaxID=496857 RepID=UPI0039A6D9F9
MDAQVKAPGVASAGGVRIAYESAGTGAPALVFIHGVLEDRTYFASQVAHFSGRRQVVTLDLRDHGESGGVAEVAIEDFVADVIAVAEEADLQGAVLCGHSMSGAVALKVAAERPDLVRGVVLLDGTVLFPEPVRQAALEKLVPALGADHWLEALRGYFRGTILSPGDPPDLVRRVMAAVEQAHPQFVQSFFNSLMASDYADDVRSARCPLLYIHAKAPADLQRLLELRPDAMVGQVIGSGHYLMLSAADQVNAMLERFLDLIGPARRPADLRVSGS